MKGNNRIRNSIGIIFCLLSIASVPVSGHSFSPMLVFLFLGIGVILYLLNRFGKGKELVLKLTVICLLNIGMIYLMNAIIFGTSHIHLIGMGISFHVLCVIEFLFFALTGKISVSLVSTWLVSFFFLAVNYYLIKYKDTVLMPMDFVDLQTAVNTVEQYELKLSEFFQMILPIALVYIGLSLNAEINFKNKQLERYIRGFSIILCILFYSTIFGKWEIDKPFKVHHFNVKVSAEEYGVLANFCLGITDTKVVKPKGYDPSQIHQEMKNYSSETTKELEDIDIIFVLGESWSIDLQKAVRSSKAIAPNLSDRFAGQYGGDLYIDTYGGGTSVSEFEVLTGLTKVHNLKEAPYKSYQLETVPNTVSYLKSLGYSTTAIHSNKKENWNRAQGYKKMGFDSYLAQEELDPTGYQTVNNYVNDTIVYDEALKVLERNEAKKNFIFCITQQNHGPYNFDGTDELGLELSKENDDVKQYLNTLHASDEYWGNFIQKLKARKKKTVVLTFGDHQPSLNKKFVSRYEKQEAIKRLETTYSINANFELQKNSVFEKLSANYLSAYLFNILDFPLTGYQKYQLDAMQQYPVMNIERFIDRAGDSIEVKDVKKTETFKMHECLQYNILHDKNKRMENFYQLGEANEK